MRLLWGILIMQRKTNIVPMSSPPVLDNIGSGPLQNVNASAAVLPQLFLPVALQEHWLSCSYRMSQRTMLMLFIVA